MRDLTLPIALPGGEVIGLRGRVATSGDELLQVEFSGLQPRHRIDAWLRLLALAVVEDAQPRAVVIGKSRSVALSAPPRAQAAELLGRYLAIYRLGLSRALPAPPRTCERLAKLRRRGVTTQDVDELAGAVKQVWEWDNDPHWSAFFGFPELLRIPAASVELPGPATGEAGLLPALAQLIWGPLLEAEVAR